MPTRPFENVVNEDFVVDEFAIKGEKRQEHEALGSHAPRCGSSEEVRFQQRLEIVDVDVAVAINHLKTGTVVVVAVLVRRINVHLKPYIRYHYTVRTHRLLDERTQVVKRHFAVGGVITLRQQIIFFRR